jgi:hypothetical protein
MQDETSEVMAVAVGETRFAFRVNGVTIAKRHLFNTLARATDGRVNEKTLAKYLVIVPYLATGFTLPEKASESVKYGATKAKRLYKALNLNEENTGPFMLAFLQLGEGNIDPNEQVKEISRSLREAGFYPERSFPSGSPTSPVKRTLH